MEQLRILCPHCQFSKELPADKVPPRAVTAKCPKCGESFTFDPATALRSAPAQHEQPATPEVIVAATRSDHRDSSDKPVDSPAQQPSQPIPPPLPLHRQAVRRAPSPRTELRGIGELLGDSWQLFQKRFGALFSTYLLFLLVGILPPVLGGGIGVLLSMVLPIGKGALVTICALIGGIAGLIGLSWGWGACVAASLNDDLGVADAFAKGRVMLLPFAWVCFLAGFVVTGGFMLLIIPGIIFSVWFFFATFVMADDDTRGMSALFKSRALAEGRWFDIFLRLLVIWAFSVVVGAIPVVGAIMMLVAVPFVLLYQALLYKDLKEVAGPVVYSCAGSDSAKLLGVALLGYLLVPAIVAGTFGVAFYKKLAPLTGGGGAPFSLNLSPSGSSTSSPVDEGGYRVIPIPGPGGAAAPPAEGQSAGSLQPSAGATVPEQQKRPEHIHLFIYSVNYAGSIKANGVELKELETKPDMQYNYNLTGENLAFGRNTITVDYSPVSDSSGQMQPRLHLKISYWKGSDKKVLGDWEIKETEAGQKSFDIDIAENM